MNNINFPNINFIHPNIYVQNGCDLYYVIFENDEEHGEIKAKLMKFSLHTLKEIKIYDVEMKNGFKEKDENVLYKGLFANFSHLIYDQKPVDKKAEKGKEK